MHSTEDKILAKFKKAKGGTLFFADNFISIASSNTVTKALERLVDSEEIVRVAKGIYTRPATDKILGKVLPNIDEIAKAIAKRDRARIVPTGSYALYKLGLTTQVPLNVVYYTDASPRKLKIGKQTITFKKASAKSLSAIGETSKLVIQALRTIGKDNVREEEIAKIRTLLQSEKPYHLQHDLKLAPEWMRKLVGSIKTNTDNE